MRIQLIAVALVFGATAVLGADWLHFRGTYNNAIAPQSQAPTTWSVGKDGAPVKNVAWKAPIPGRGVSGPILIGDRVVVTCASGYKGDRLHVVCVDAKSGKQVWERQFWATGRTMCHPTSSVAAPTPASDGQRIYAFYSSNDLACLDLDGNLLWYRGLTQEFPTAANDTGMSSSPLVVGDTVIVQVENMGDSFAMGIDTTTGETRWKLERERSANWASPIIVRGKSPKEDLVLLQSPKRLTAHRPRTGELVWEFDKSCSSIPSAVVDNDVVYVPSGGLTALRHDASGQTVDQIWNAGPLGPSSASPVVYGSRVYTLNGASVLLCADAATGEVAWKVRLSGRFWATPVVVGEHLYAVNQDGLAQVVRLGDQGEKVAENDFGESMLGSPAVGDGALFFRSDAHLWKIAGDG